MTVSYHGPFRVHFCLCATAMPNLGQIQFLTRLISFNEMGEIIYTLLTIRDYVQLYERHITNSPRARTGAHRPQAQGLSGWQ